MTKHIKMIGLDLDGTLLNEQKELTGYTRRVLTKAIEQGIVVLPATGRPISGVPQEVREFPGIRYFLTSNGARIIDQETDTVIFEGLMPVESAGKVLDILAEYDTLREIFCEGKGYIDESGVETIKMYLADKRMVDYILSTRLPVPDLGEYIRIRKHPVDKVRASFASQKDRQAAFERIKGLPEVYVTSAFDNDIEVNCAGIHKGRGLLELGNHLGIAAAEIMGCGDGLNDIEMVRQVGVGVAMANAVDELKACADYITETNEKDGAAKAIEKFVLGEGEK